MIVDSFMFDLFNFGTTGPARSESGPKGYTAIHNEEI